MLPGNSTRLKLKLSRSVGGFIPRKTFNNSKTICPIKNALSRKFISPICGSEIIH